MKRPSRRRAIKGFIGYKKAPSQAFVAQHLLYEDVSMMTDARAAFASIANQINKTINALEGPVTQQAIAAALGPTFELSQLYCPIDSGAMKESGYLVVEQTGNGVTGEIGYAAGNDPPYTIYVHERTDLHHVQPTRAKWLEAAMNQDADNWLPRLAAAYSKAGVVTK